MGILFGAKNDTDQFLWDLVCRKLKNQTRRPINPGDYMPAMSKVARATVLTAKDRVRFAVGQTHAVQPKMSQPCVWIGETSGDYAHITRFSQDSPNTVGIAGCTILECAQRSIFSHDGKHHPADYLRDLGYRPARIEIVDLWREDVRNITLSDAKAEGFENEINFWACWCSVYDKKTPFSREKRGAFGDYFVDRTTVDVRRSLMLRPSELYQSWALSFKLVEV